MGEVSNIFAEGGSPRAARCHGGELPFLGKTWYLFSFLVIISRNSGEKNLVRNLAVCNWGKLGRLQLELMGLAPVAAITVSSHGPQASKTAAAGGSALVALPMRGIGA